MGNLFQELKRRKVYKVTTVYVVSSWLLLQVADTLLPAFDLPDSAIRIPALILLIGFPLVLILAWVFELTPQGIKKTLAAGPEETVTISKRDYAINAVLLLLIGVVAVQQYYIFNRPAGDMLSSLTEGRSIAVLPLDNLSPDPDNAYFAAGVHEEILNQLAKITELRVISRTSSLRYKETELSLKDIASELNVSTIMEGSVRFAGNRVRITTQLIRASDDAHIWSAIYDFELDDIFAIQSDVAIQIAERMQATISPDEIANIEQALTESTEAYLLFLQAKYAPNGYADAYQKLEQAIQLDPSFAHAYGRMAWLKFNPAQFLGLEEKNSQFDQALKLAKSAIEIDPTVTDAYTALSGVAFERHQWEDWEHYSRIAVALPDLDGNSAFIFANFLSYVGRYEESYHWHEVAIAKQPKISGYRARALEARIYARDYEAALEIAEQFLELGGQENLYHALRAFIFHFQDRMADAQDEVGKITTDRNGLSNLDYIVFFGYPDFVRCASGEQKSVMEEIRESAPGLEQLARTGYCAAGAGDLDTLFEMSRQVMLFGVNLANLSQSPAMDEAKKDPRWQAVGEYMELPDMN